MFRFDGFRRSRQKARLQSTEPNLNTQILQERAMRNIRRIALLGIVLILMDLGLSLTDSSVGIDRDGNRLFLLRPAAGEAPGYITLDASVKTGSGRIVHRFTIRLEPQRTGTEEEDPQAQGAPAAERSEEDLIRSEFRSIAAGFNEDLSSRRIPLPAALDSGEAIRWSRARSTNTLLLALMSFAMILLIYRSRLRPLQKQQEAQQQSVRRHLPAFLNELVLLLNAGLVLTRAFEMTVEQSESFGSSASGSSASGSSVSGSTAFSGSAGADDDYFTKNIHRIYHVVKHTNGVLHEELQRFASDSGVSELLRVSGVISDNISKGAALNEKLERESESLWLARRRLAEQQGRLAETKMTLPLAIFLCVLIVITVSPALLQL